MPTISKPCVDFYKISDERIDYGSFKGYTVSSMITVIQGRARPDETSNIHFLKEKEENSLTTQTRLLKSINNFKRELNARFELEKSQGMELNQEDEDMIYILENILPDIILNACQKTRNSNNFKDMGGGRKRNTKKSRKNKKTRKYRKV